jgi:hypothetical protein
VAVEAVAATATAVAAAVLILLAVAAGLFAPTLVLVDVIVVAVDSQMGICLSLLSIIQHGKASGYDEKIPSLLLARLHVFSQRKRC